MKKIKKFIDVLVVGGGAAGLKAALTLKEKSPKLRVAIALKGKAGRSGTTSFAVSDRMAFHATLPYTMPEGPENWKFHADDIFKIGSLVSDMPLAEILAKESNMAVQYLSDKGMPFSTEKEGCLVQFLTDGSIYPRACSTGPYTSIDLKDCLLNEVDKHGIDIYNDCMVADVILYKGRVAGAVGIEKSGDIVLFNAPYVVLATGGAGSLFKDNCYPAAMTGDGYGIALRCGAELVNMEFIQFGVCSKKLKTACSGSMMRAMPCITDALGREVMPDFYKKTEDILNITFRKGASWPVSYEEESKIVDIIASQKGSLKLDYTKNPSGWGINTLPSAIMKWYKEKGVRVNRTLPFLRLQMINPQIFKHFKDRGIDLEKEPLKVFLAAQHFQGGVKIDEWGATNVKGLFACGECAGGQHGANRPGGNALLDSQVFGRRSAIKIIAELASERYSMPDIDESYIMESRNFFNDREVLKRVAKQLKEDMSRYVSVVREEAKLMNLFDSLVELNKGFRLSMLDRREAELSNMILTALAVVKSCIERKESRGPHLFWKEGKLVPRDTEFDYKYLVVNQKKGKITAGLQPVSRIGRVEG